MKADVSFGQLIGVLVKYLGRHRWLVLTILIVGISQAVLLKAPYLLVKEFTDLLFPTQELGAKANENALYNAFLGVKENIFAMLGLEGLLPAGDPSTPEYKQAAFLGMGAMLAILAVLGCIAIYAYRMLASFLATRVVVDMRSDLCAHLMSLSLRFFGRQRTGDLISRVSNDTAVLMRSFHLSFDNAVIEPLFILGNFVLAYSVSPWLGLVVLLLIPLLALPMHRFGHKVRKGSGRSLEALGEATDTMAQMFGGFRTVKAFQLEKQEIDEFKGVNERFLGRTMRMMGAKAKSHALLYLLYMMSFAVALIALRNVILAGELGLTSGDVAFALFPLGTTYQHVKRLTRTYNVLRESQGALDRIQGLLDERSEIIDRRGAIDVETLEGEIEFRKVSFAYDDQPVLRDLSFKVRVGEKVAFVGPSGAGKSTILDLLARFYDPDEGTILVDDHDLRTLRLGSYLRNVATVDQTPFLFNRTIRENILLGKPGASEEEIREASRIALVDEFVSHLPQGFDTVVGERGSSLSGGQLQRITIARAVIRDPRILLLDEATSALDTESEKTVQAALDNLMEGRTSILIAHRLSTVRGADRILVIDKGDIVEEGAHEELMARDSSAYRRLNLMQS